SRVIVRLRADRQCLSDRSSSCPAVFHCRNQRLSTGAQMHDAPVGRNLPGRCGEPRAVAFTTFAASFSTKRARLSTNHFDLVGRAGSCRLSELDRAGSDLELLLDDLDLDVDRDRAVQLDWDIERAERLERLGQVDVLAVEGKSTLLEGFDDVLARDRAVHLAFFTEGASDLHAGAFEPLGQLLGGGDLLALASGGRFLQLFDAREVAGSRRHREAARQQVVAREARTNFDDFTTGAEVVDVRLKQNMGIGSHGSSPQSLVVKGKSAIVRARLIANCTERWCLAHTPEIRRGTIFPRSVTK